MTTFAEAEWDLDTWDTYLVTTGTPGTVERQRLATGGNPGPGLRVINTLPSSDDTVYLFHFKQGAAYTPAVSGAIDSVEFRINAKPISSTHPSGMGADGMGLRLALRQNEKNYFVDKEGISTNTGNEIDVWRTIAATGFRSQDFRTLDDANDHPDFSAAGSEIQLGFRSSNRSDTVGYSLTADFDNWFVLLQPAVPQLDAPVTLHLGESVNGVFADPSIDLSFFQLVDLPVGSEHEIGDQFSGESWYQFRVRDRSRSRGLIAYQGETLLAELSRAKPKESLILVAGESGVPSPLDLRECLQRFLTYYGVPFDPALPPFMLRTSDGIVTPTTQAFVIQPDPEDPQSIFEWLERFFGPFRGYTWRADSQNRLVVRPPAWLDTIGLRLRLSNTGRTSTTTVTYPWPWPDRAPTVDYSVTIGLSEQYTGSVGPLDAGDSEEIDAGLLTFTVSRSADGESIAAALTGFPFHGGLGTWTGAFTARPSSGNLSLASNDLGTDEIETSSADSVINQVILPVRRRTFEPEQPLMQPAALLLRSPQQTAAGAFGNNPLFGPMAWAPESPVDFLELANAHGEEGTWFWPIADEVVIKPGGQVTVALDVEEWAEQWRPENNTTVPHAEASNANSYTDSVVLPANGQEVKLLDFQFPRQTSDFAPSPFGARGELYGRWRGGDEPGIELRIPQTSRFVEFGYLAEVGGIFGQTVYFLWGVQVKLNGNGITWTEGPLELTRFAFARASDGTWEGGANVPGLAESQRLFPNRVYRAPELPYEVTPDVALSIARAIVEENHVPKVVYQVPITPARDAGYAYDPRHLGGAADVQPLSVKGRITAHDYSESHTPAGETSALVIDVEVSEALPNTPAAPTGRLFGRAYYGVTTYQPAEEA